MPTARAHVPTQRAHSYLEQLSDHLSHMSHSPTRHGPRASLGHDARTGPSSRGQSGHDRTTGRDGGHAEHGGPPAVHNIDRSDDHARIEFDWGRCDLTAGAAELVVDVHAADRTLLARGQELLQRRIETIGRRDELTIIWQPVEPT